MEAKVLHIDQKVKKGELDVSQLSDFRYRSDRTVDARVILERPEISLYCLDDAQRLAVFVETPPAIDLSAKPYCFVTQYQNALRLYTTTYDVLNGLGETMGDRFKTLIPMHSVGRTGGTLLSRAVNRLDTVFCLDEPDVYNNIVLMRPPDGSRDAELTQVIKSCTRLLYKPSRSTADTLFMKFRWITIEVGDLLYKAFPNAKTLFLYRSADTWTRSALRSAESLVESAAANKERGSMVAMFELMNITKNSSDLNKPAPAEADVEGLRRSIPLLSPYIRRILRSKLKGMDMVRLLWSMVAEQFPIMRNHITPPSQLIQPYLRTIPPVTFLTLMWLSVMHKYLELDAKGVPILAVRYETLVQAPEAALRAIFEHCGLPVDQAGVAETAFGEDSQKGTPLDWDRIKRSTRKDLSAEHLEQLREVLQEHPPITTPDFVVPHTLQL